MLKDAWINIKKILLFLTPLLGYIFLTVVLTYPLITKFFTFIPGAEGDAHIYLYYEWWLKYSIANSLDFFSSPLLLYPYGANLSLAATTLFNNVIISFFDIFLPSVASFNLFVITSFSLSGWGMYWLLQYLIKNKTSSFIGGCLFAFHPYVFSKLADGHFNYSTIYFIPLFILFLLKATREKYKKYLNTILAALFLVIGLYTDFYYAYGLIFILVIYFVWLWCENKKITKTNIKVFTLIISLFCLFSLPLSIRLGKLYLTPNDIPAPTMSQIAVYSPDIRSFFIPSPANTYFGKNLKNYYQDIAPHNSVVFVGYTLIALMIFGYWTTRKDHNALIKLWFFLSLFFLFCALGPILSIGSISAINSGQLNIILPYSLLYYLPFLKNILVPSRLIIFCLLFFIIPASFGLRFLIGKIKNKIYLTIVIILVVSLIVFEYSSFPIPLSSTDIPKFYNTLALETESYTILELPFALSTSFYTLGNINASSKLQYFQSVHHKAILGGYVSRVPNRVYNEYQKTPGLSYLIDPSEYDYTSEKKNNLETTIVKKTFSDLKIKYIIIHPEYYVNLNYNKHVQLTNTLNYLTKIFGANFTEDNLIIYNLKDEDVKK